MDESGKNKRIAKNTVYLYFRMLLLLCIGLYTSRVVLNALGVVDFGVYNVVGSIVAILGFINGSMGTATSRFLSYELGGEADKERLSKVFHTALSIHLGIGVLVFAIGEGAGLWYVFNELKLPADRTVAAAWVLQCSLVTAIFQIVSVPYSAVIISRERMQAFAYISVFEAVMQLGVAFVVKFSSCDRLILYAVLLMVIQVIVRMVYGWYCSRHFHEVRGRLTFDRLLFKEMAKFAGWIMNGALAIVCYMQGLNIMLNFFFGPAVNAARGLATTVQGKAAQFCQNFQTAAIPQITKSYANGEFGYMHSLIVNSTVFSLYLMLLLSLPLLLETEFIMRIWLGEVPPYTVQFVRITLLVGLVETMRLPMNSAVHATGKIKRFQLWEGSVLLGILPVGWLCLHFGCGPVSVFVVQLGIFILAQFIRVMIVCPMIRMSKMAYFRGVVVRFSVVAVAACVPPVALKLLGGFDGGWQEFFVLTGLSVVSVAVSVWVLGLSAELRHSLAKKIAAKLKGGR